MGQETQRLQIDSGSCPTLSEEGSHGGVCQQRNILTDAFKGSFRLPSFPQEYIGLQSTGFLMGTYTNQGLSFSCFPLMLKGFGIDSTFLCCIRNPKSFVFYFFTSSFTHGLLSLFLCLIMTGWLLQLQIAYAFSKQKEGKEHRSLFLGNTRLCAQGCPQQQVKGSSFLVTAEA